MLKKDIRKELAATVIFKRAIMLPTLLPMVVFVFFYLVPFSEAQPANKTISQQSSKMTGTYTSMHFNKEGGDLLGQELKIVTTRKGYQGALQFAEGGAGDLIVVDVHIDGNKISFVVPDTCADAGQFNGTIQNGVIQGLFKFKGGGENQILLRKGKSYWD